MVNMKMFLGEYQPNLTDGSRLALPKKLREQILGDEIVLSRGFEKPTMTHNNMLKYFRKGWTPK